MSDHAKMLTTAKVDLHKLVRFQSGWLAAVSLRGLLRQDKHVLENATVVIKVRFLERSLGLAEALVNRRVRRYELVLC